MEEIKHLIHRIDAPRRIDVFHLLEQFVKMFLCFFFPKTHDEKKSLRVSNWLASLHTHHRPCHELHSDYLQPLERVGEGKNFQYQLSWLYVQIFE
jgi:hypothetical protein